MTTPRSFFKILNRRKIISAIALGLGAASTVAVVWLPPRVQADTAPEWLRTAAQDNLPKYPEDTVAVTLLSEQQTIVKDNGDIETRYRRAYRLLRPEARKQFGTIAVQFDNETKLSFLKAWTITSTGQQMELKEKDAIESGMTGYELYNDTHVKYLRFPEANPGSVVGYEYVQRQRPFIFEHSWAFQQDIPTRRSRFSLQIPAGWEFTNRWVNYPEQEPQSSATNQYVWEVTDLPGVEEEPRMPSVLAVVGRMDIKYFPRDPKLRGKTSGTWNDLGIWYAGLTSGSRDATPAIQQKVGELTAGITDPVAKMKALTSYVQRQVRYVAIEIGIGGYQPHPAASVFTHQYGDCKDKATLLSAMLHEIGIESDYVLIDVQRGIVNPEFPSTRFNHVILAIRLPESLTDPSLFAVVDYPKLGRLLFFDPTNEYVTLGYLPSYLQDNFGLVVTSNGGTMISLPLLPPATNRLLRTAQMNLSASGDLAGEVKEVRWGGPAEDSREAYLGVSPSERRKIMENFLGSSLSNFTLKNASIGNLEQYDQDLTFDYNFVAMGYAKLAGNLLIVRPRVVGGKGSSLLTGKPRKYPIEFEEATRQDDIFDITLPSGYVVDELPQPVYAKCAYATYKSEVQVTGNVLQYKRTYEITDLVAPIQKLDEVRDFFHQIAADEKSSAVLRRANP
jgi:transglutaminase-like putative cysteine protease